MSGGHFEYQERRLCSELFGFQLWPDYGEDGRKHSGEARKLNPLEDKEFSEMVYDMLCVIHSFDYYKSGDTDEEQYREDLEFFKRKWMGKSDQQRTREEIDKSISELKDELYKTLNCGDMK